MEVAKVLVIQVNVDVTVSTSFGLEFPAFAVILFTKEVLMNSSFVQSCVWCGVAFLRGHSGTLPTQARGYLLQKHLLSREKRRGVQVPSLAPFLGIASHFSLTTHSSRRRFAERFNSGVRLYELTIFSQKGTLSPCLCCMTFGRK